MLEGVGWTQLSREELWNCSSQRPDPKFFSLKMVSRVNSQPGISKNYY